MRRGRGRRTDFVLVTEAEQAVLRAALEDGWLDTTTGMEQQLITKGLANYQVRKPGTLDDWAAHISNFGRTVMGLIDYAPD